VVVLPFVPVTSAVGTSVIAFQRRRSSTRSVSSMGQARDPLPSPTETRLSSISSVTPCAVASFVSPFHHGFRSRSIAWRSCGKTSRSGVTDPPASITRVAKPRRLVHFRGGAVRRCAEGEAQAGRVCARRHEGGVPADAAQEGSQGGHPGCACFSGLDAIERDVQDRARNVEQEAGASQPSRIENPHRSTTAHQSELSTSRESRTPRSSRISGQVDRVGGSWFWLGIAPPGSCPARPCPTRDGMTTWFGCAEAHLRTRADHRLRHGERGGDGFLLGGNDLDLQGGPLLEQGRGRCAAPRRSSVTQPSSRRQM
jgi:hypothetical protein